MKSHHHSPYCWLPVLIMVVVADATPLTFQESEPACVIWLTVCSSLLRLAPPHSEVNHLPHDRDFHVVQHLPKRKPVLGPIGRLTG